MSVPSAATALIHLEAAPRPAGPVQAGSAFAKAAGHLGKFAVTLGLLAGCYGAIVKVFLQAYSVANSKMHAASQWTMVGGFGLAIAGFALMELSSRIGPAETIPMNPQLSSPILQVELAPQSGFELALGVPSPSRLGGLHQDHIAVILNPGDDGQHSHLAPPRLPQPRVE